uniref:Rho GDP-dissociation inhibitor 1 n=1 Tax=Schistosoma haematobium TaxID=6185 RepID=A0A095A238_SCHHA
MAEQSVEEGDLESDIKTEYKPPEKRTLEEIMNLDKEDESLRKYKEALLGPSVGTFKIPCDISNFKSKPVSIVEGCSYRIQVVYYVQRDIVCGLRFKQWLRKGPILVDEISVMLGNFRPQGHPHIWTSDPEEAPKGVLSRGLYKIVSQFIDDDKAEYITWKWCINIVKKSADS